MGTALGAGHLDTSPSLPLTSDLEQALRVPAPWLPRWLRPAHGCVRLGAGQLHGAREARTAEPRELRSGREPPTPLPAGRKTHELSPKRP